MIRYKQAAEAAPAAIENQFCTVGSHELAETIKCAAARSRVSSLGDNGPGPTVFDVNPTAVTNAYTPKPILMVAEGMPPEIFF